MADDKELKEYAARKRKRRIKRGVQRFLVLFVAVLVILGLAALITHLIQSAADDPIPQATTGAPVTPMAPESIPTNLSNLPDIDGSEWNFIGPVEQTINEMEITAPDYRMIALPENGRVDMTYFDNVTFVGDSITQGLQLFQPQGIPNAHYCAYKSISPRGIYDGSIHTRADTTDEVPMEALVASQPDNVYILLGTNAMVGMEDDDILLAYYKEMLDAIRANLLPGVNFYIQSVTPIRPEAAKGFLTNERIVGFNNKLAKLAFEEGYYFVDLHEALAGDDAYLRSDFAAADGIHMSRAGYSAWVEYLVTHTAYSPRNPYLEGSSYYAQDPSSTTTPEA